jgi:hypothetical protein
MIGIRSSTTLGIYRFVCVVSNAIVLLAVDDVFAKVTNR